MMLENPEQLFISHASEDKDSIVREMASILTKYGVKVWYDEYDIQFGESISQKIDSGLVSSKFGLVVLSESFFTKYWTNEELSGIRTLNSSGKLKKIIPIWLNIDHERVASFSAILADKRAIVSDGSNAHEVCLKVLEAAFPNLLNEFSARKIVEEKSKSAPTMMVEIADLKKSQVRRDGFSANFLARAALVHEVLKPLSFGEFLESFSRDLNPHAELVWWEFFAYFYTGLCNAMEHKNFDKTKLYEDLFSCLMGPGPRVLLEKNEDVSSCEEAIIFMGRAIEFYKEIYSKALDENRKITIALSDY